MIQISVVGKTNVGKSSFVKACTLANIEISNRPFTTIKPNTGIAYVRTQCACKDLPEDIKCGKCCDGTRFVPVKLFDVAGLIQGAHEGRGLGNQFLSDAMESKALIHVIDLAGSTNAEGVPVEPGTHDPQQDIEMLTSEIDYWILDLIKKDARIISNTAHTDEAFSSIIANRLAGLGITHEQVQASLNKVREYFTKAPSKWTDSDFMDFIAKLRKTAKPIIIAGNKYDIDKAKENLENLKKENIIPCSAEVELALREASMQKNLISYIPGDSKFQIKENPTANPGAQDCVPVNKMLSTQRTNPGAQDCVPVNKMLTTKVEINEKQKKALEFMRKYLEDNKNTGVQQILDSVVFELLNMIVVYPVADEHKYTDKKGNILPDAHLVPKGITAREFAYYIHEDIGKKFISAVDCKRHQNIGAEHELQNGDIICIRAAK